MQFHTRCTEEPRTFIIANASGTFGICGAALLFHGKEIANELIIHRNRLVKKFIVFV